MYRALSLFSNCGAGDIGYSRAGFSFEVMAELEQKRLDVCLLNHPKAKGVVGDLRNTWEEVVALYNSKTDSARLDLLTACPPCQGLSSARGKRGDTNDANSGSLDERNLLVTVICQMVMSLKPRIVVVENVPQFLSRKVLNPKNGQVTTAANILIEEIGDSYHIYPVILDLTEFGIPQFRKRCFITCIIKEEIDISKYLLSELATPYPQITHSAENGSLVSFEQALSSHKLPKLDARSAEKAYATDYHELHFVPVMSEDRYEMVATIPSNSGMSAWQNNTCQKCHHENVAVDLVCGKCREPLLKPTTKDKKGRKRLIKGFSTSYKRMGANGPSATILTASGHISSHNTIHPTENRVLSALECQILQTFPDSFKWGKTLQKHGSTNVRAMIGEAVPPKFTRLHGKVLMNILTLNERSKMMSIDDKRAIHAWKKLE